MAEAENCLPLTRESVQAAHRRIEPYIHRTPVVTCRTLNEIAYTPQAERSTGLDGQEDGDSYNARLNTRLFFKCENQQKIGAFKARGAFHALSRLIEQNGLDNVKATGVCTHSSGMAPNELASVHC